MTETLHGIQVTNRCTWFDGQRLCGDPAPYLITGSSFCALHALETQQYFLHKKVPDLRTR